MAGFSGKHMQKPFSHLPDSDGGKYCLQLNLYKRILEREYDVKVSHMYIASIHPDNPICYIIPELTTEADWLLDCQIRLARVREAVSTKHPTMCCPKSGVLLTDPVRWEDRVVQRAWVVIQRCGEGTKLASEDGVRNSVQKEVSKENVNFPMPPLTCSEWHAPSPYYCSDSRHVDG